MGALALVGFGYIEGRAPEPILPPRLFRAGRYRIYPILGGGVLPIGMPALLRLRVGTTTAAASALTLAAGVGIGLLMQSTVLITMNSADLRDMGAASGSVTLFRTVGGSLGVALFGTVYAGRVESTLVARLGTGTGRKIASGGGP